MRSSFVVAICLCFACSSKKSADDHAAPETGAPPTAPAKPVVKKPVPKTPLPTLAADPGGATGKPVWTAGFGGLGIDAPRGIAVDDAGNSYVAGYFEGEIDFGGAIGKRKSAGGSDAFVVKLDATGKVAWAQTFGAKRDDAANAIAVHGDTVVVVGNFLDELKLGDYDKKARTGSGSGDPANMAQGSDDVFVAAFGTDGTPKWLWTLGGIDSDGANAVASSPDGGWVIGGSFRDGIVDTGIALKARGGTDALLAKLAPSGDLEWIKQFGGTGDDQISHVAVDAQGSIYIQGVFKDVADFGGKPLKAANGSDTDVVLAKYDVNGDHVWSQRFGNPFNDVAGGVTVDPSGHVTMVGSFEHNGGPVSFGPGDSHDSAGESDIFVAHYTTDGKLEWAHTFGADREDIGWGVAADSSGNIVMTGWFQRTVDFGKGPIESKGNKDVFALKLDPKGAIVWVDTWGDHDHDQGRAVALDKTGASYVTGIYRFKLALVDPPLDSHRPATGVESMAPKPDAFVVKLAR